MSISSTTRKAGPYMGNGETTVLPFSFKVFTSADVRVVRADLAGVEYDLTLTTDYTVTLNADQDSNHGGTVNLVTAAATGYLTTLTSQVGNLQPVVLTNAGGFYPTVINTALDRLTIMVQQLAEKVSRTLQYSISSTLGDAALPTPVANNIIGWNSSANGFQNYAPADNTLLSVSLSESSGSSLVGFIQAGTGAVSRTAQSKMRDIVSVKDFTGVDPLGVLDSTAGIQSALDAGKRVYFGSASDSYVINGTLTLSSGHYLDFGGALLTQTATQAPMFDASSTDNVTIIGGRFVGKTEATFTNTPSSLAICITASNATDLTVSGNRFENFWYSPLMINGGGNRIEFSNNFVRGPTTGILSTDTNFRNCTGATITGANIRITGNDIYGTAQGLIVGQGSSNIDITGNTIHDLINEHGIYADTGLKGLTITGNVIRHTGVNGSGIKVQHYDAYGVAPENIVISGNSVSYTGADGIIVINVTASGTLYASGVSITGNTIYQAGQHGIDVRYARGCTVSGNSIEQSVSSGLYVSKCTVMDVTGNSIRITGSHGIFDDGTSGDVTYASNIINTPGTNPENDCGFLVQGVSEHSFINNVVRGVSTKTLCSFFISAATSLTTTEVRGNSFTGSNGAAARFPVGVGQLRYFGENVLKAVAGNDIGQSVPETIQRGSEENNYFGTEAPTTGTWHQGTKVISRYPAAGGFIGWVCVVGGTPGTWRTFGSVTA